MFGMWEPFVIFGTLGFWGISLLIALAFIWCIEIDKSGGAAFMVVFTFLFLWGAVGINPVLWALSNPMSALTYVAVYFLGGTIWTIVKWYFYLLRRRDEAKKIKIYFEANEHDLRKDWSSNKTDTFSFVNWMNSTSRHSSPRHEYLDNDYPPMATHHKGDILFWAAYWPFSAFWTLLNDPIRRLWNAIYALLGGLLHRMSISVFKDV